MVEEKQEGVYFTPLPPGKIGLTDKFGHDGIVFSTIDNFYFQDHAEKP